MRKIIEKYLDAFAANDNDIGKVSLIEHVINTGDSMPIKCRPRQYSLEHKKAVDEEIGKYKQIGAVRPPTSPWASPIFIVKKKDKSNRLCVDYRRLNMATIKDSFSIANTLFDRQTSRIAMVYST
jgi:hypothetical protein